MNLLDSDIDVATVLSRIAANRNLAKTFMTVCLATIVLVEPAAAQMGDIYCGTNVETGIDLVFGGLIGLGVPAGMFYVGRSGLSYMRAQGNPEQRERARRDLVMSGVGFGVLILAIISPELVDKFGSNMGFAISDCVKPL